jgi:hypothetical protein
LRFRRTLSAGTASANRTAQGSIGRIFAFCAEIKASSIPAPNATLLVAKAVLCDGFRYNQRKLLKSTMKYYKTFPYKMAIS